VDRQVGPLYGLKVPLPLPRMINRSPWLLLTAGRDAVAVDVAHGQTGRVVAGVDAGMVMKPPLPLFKKMRYPGFPD